MQIDSGLLSLESYHRRDGLRVSLTANEGDFIEITWRSVLPEGESRRRLELEAEQAQWMVQSTENLLDGLHDTLATLGERGVCGPRWQRTLELLQDPQLELGRRTLAVNVQGDRVVLEDSLFGEEAEGEVCFSFADWDIVSAAVLAAADELTPQH